MNQEGMRGLFCAALSHAFELEELDFTGDNNVGDEGINFLTKGEIKVEGQQHPQIVGL